MSGKIFISYRRSDEAYARRLHALLREQGVESWYDAQVGAGQDWRQATAAALHEARIFVLLFSKAASESADVAKELAAATFSKKLVIPVRLENIEPTGAFLYELASRNWFDAYHNTDARLAELARSLAETIRGGDSGEGTVQFERGARPKGKARGLWAAAALLCVAVGGFAYLNRGDEQLPPPVQRTAFFGFDTSSDDPVVRGLAASATTQVFETMNGLRLDTVASSQTQGTPPERRLARAKELGALYALSGDARSESGRVVLSIRLDDVVTNATLWSESIEGPASDTVSLPIQAAALATDTVKCVMDFRASLPRDDSQVVARLPVLCRAIRQGPADVIEISRSVRDLAPDSASLQANFAQAVLLNFRRYPESAQPALMAEGEAALANATRIDPRDPFALLARYTLAIIKRAAPLELERIALEVLKVLPQDATLNMYYGNLLRSLGRTRDAMAYVALAVANDPLSPPKTSAQADLFAEAGRAADSQAAFARVNQRTPNATAWALWMRDSLFAGVGDPAPLFDSPPATVSAAAIACWRDIHRAYTGPAQAGRRAAIDRIKACRTEGHISMDSAVVALTAFGDLDAAFALAPELRNRDVLFSPALRAMRADPRFADLAAKLGLTDYWRDSKNRPDFCATESVPVCSLIG